MTSDLQPFYPPRLKPLLTRLIQSLCYLVAYQGYRFSLSISEDDVARARGLANSRLVYVCNHPTMEDGIAVFTLSARLGQLFYYIVARESFKGLQGKFLQAIGCYSIRRGLGDRASIAQTLKLLKAPRCRLVIFPEGGCSYQNDTVMPFRAGAIQMPLQVISQLARQDGSAEVPDLYLVPVSLKYRYTQPMALVIDQTLKGLEQALAIQPGQSDFYARLIAIAHCILTRLETEYQLPPPPDLDWNQRIDRLRQHVIAWCETQLDLPPAPPLPIRERVYKIQALLEANDAPTKRDEALYWTTVRLLNFDAIYRGYVAENPTPERFLDTLMRLEREVYQTEHIKPKAHRRAIFKIGEPINLKDYLAAYQADKASTVEQLTMQMQTIVQRNLEQDGVVSDKVSES
jgi:1-acyl-sn-glycerol-3-phosphate acyltransferase